MSMGNGTAKTIPLFLALSGLVLAALVALTGCNPDELSVENEPVSTSAQATQPPFSLEGVATQTPTPFPTATPTATPTPTAIPIPPRAILADEAYAFLEAFLRDHDRRGPGTSGERAAALALRDRLTQLGFETRVEEFDLGPAPSEVSFELRSSEGTMDMDVQSEALQFSPHGSVNGELVYVQRALEGQLPETGLQGKVALIERGDDTFSGKAIRAARAGASAAVIFNYNSGNYAGYLVSESPIPTVAISGNDGNRLLDALDAGSVQATVRVSRLESRSLNVIAERKGTDPNGGVVYLTTYIDAVSNVAGANDNGSGIASLMTIAEMVSIRSYPFTVRLALFGSVHGKESGSERAGSRFHVNRLSNSDIADIKVMTSVYMCGSGDTLGLYGSESYRSIMSEIGDDLSIAITDNGEWPINDDISFDEFDVETLTMTGDDQTHHHQPTDTLENIDRDLLGQTVEAMIQFLEALAQLQ